MKLKLSNIYILFFLGGCNVGGIIGEETSLTTTNSLSLNISSPIIDGSCYSGTIQILDPNAKPIVSSSPISVTVSSNSSGGYFSSDSKCLSSSSTITVPAGQSSTTLYYSDYVTGTSSLAMTSDGLISSSSDVSVAEPDWGTASTLESSNQPTGQYAMADASANYDFAIAFAQSNGVALSLYLRYYSSSSGWQNLTLIESTDNAISSTPPRIKMFEDNSGALIVWLQSDGTRNRVYASVYSSSNATATAPTLVDNIANVASGLTISVNSSNNGIACWKQFNGITTNAYASFFTKSTGLWSAPVVVDTLNGPVKGRVNCAIFSDGTAIASWYQTDNGAIDSAYGSYYNGATWSAPTSLEASAIPVSDLGMVSNSSENAMIQIQHTNGAAIDLFSATFTRASNTFSTEVAAEDSAVSADPSSYLTTFDDKGNAILVWKTSAKDLVYNLYTNGTWGTTLSAESSANPVASFYTKGDAKGNMLLLYAINDGLGGGILDLYSRRYIQGYGWRNPDLVESGSLTADYPRSVLFKDGTAYAFWAQSDGSAQSLYFNSLGL